MTETVLSLSGIGIVPLSSRGVTERLSPISNGELRRTVNGTLVDTTTTNNRKFQVSLSGGDVQPPALNGVWRGQATTVQCVTELGKVVTLTAGAASNIALDRKPVTGSGRALFKLSETEVIPTTNVSFSSVTGGWVAAVDFGVTGYAGAASIFYRPEIDCLVDNWNSDTDEYAAAPGWTLDLLEV